MQRGLVGEIVKRFEQRGYELKALKMKIASEELLNTHYADLTSKGFFPALREYMCSGPVVCMVWCVAALASSASNRQSAKKMRCSGVEQRIISL